MAFVLEEITEEMRQKIIDDAACDHKKLLRLLNETFYSTLKVWICKASFLLVALITTK